MKKIIGIVSEYNPFHAGHAWHISETRRIAGEESVIVCCMSGDFVQRGEWAIQPKFLRAEAAVRGGADAVFELPLPWCLSSAQRFAAGSVGMLARLGITHLSFGSECGSLETLREAAAVLSAPDFEHRVRDRMRSDPSLSYPAARKREGGDRIPDSPNDMLAVEYLLALQGTSIEPICVPRTGRGHDERGDGPFPSASELRARITAGVLPLPHADNDAFSLAILSRLRMFERSYFEALPDCADGLGIRIFDAVRRSTSLPEIFDAAKTKRYTHSRVRRAVMCAALGVMKGENEGLPPYARLLAADENGRAFLTERRKNSSIPVITRPKQISLLGKREKAVFARGASAHDLYQLAWDPAKPVGCGDDYRTGPFLV